jgi:hypothetical protein
MIHNILKLQGSIKIIDFEDSILERKWVFSDITDLLFQKEGWSRDEIVECLRRLGDTRGYGWNNDELQDHFTYGFIRYFIRTTVMIRRSEADKAEAVAQLRRLLNGNP